MPDVLARNLIDKAVIGSDGSELGTLSTITMDPETGALGHLLVTPHADAGVDEAELDESGRFAVSMASVQAVKDHVVVGR